MRVPELASRYAKAIFDLSGENKNQDKVFGDLREIGTMLEREKDILDWFTTPLVKPEERLAAIEKAVKTSGVSDEVQKLLALLARKNRLKVFTGIVHAFQNLKDSANGVCRGTVRSATVLAPAERQKIESIVEQVLKKKVIMTYKEDPSVIGGLVAQVGSFTFDDSLQAHLRRMNEELKRRTV